jgi:hypothetical protein
VVAGASAEDMAAAMAMYPMMKDAISKMNTENVRLQGTPVQTITKMEAVESAEQMAQQEKQSEADSKPNPSGGLGGMLGGMMAKKMAAKKKDDEVKGRATVMTMTSETLKVTTDVSAADVAIPAGFQQKQ